MESCRVATRDDVARLVELADELRVELIALRGGALWADREALSAPLADTFTAWLERPDGHVLGGCLDDVVVGYAVVEIETLRSGGRLGVVHELFVELGARSVGVGEVVAGSIVAICRDAGCSGIDARALPGHRAAKNFFEARGFTARAIVMHHDLD